MAKKPDPDPLVRKTVTLRESLWKDVEGSMRSQGAATLAEAVRRLLSRALQAESQDKKRGAE